MSDSYNTSKKEFEKSFKLFMNERESPSHFFVTYQSDMFNTLHPVPSQKKLIVKHLNKQQHENTKSSERQ